MLNGPSIPAPATTARDSHKFFLRRTLGFAGLGLADGGGYVRQMLNQTQKAAYTRDGFLVLPDFCTAAQCQTLRERAGALVESFDPSGVRTIFSTNAQTRTSDDYFLGSGDKVRFFFEPEAFASDGTLRQPKQLSINKIGHALHTLDEVFAPFSQQPQWAELAQDLGVAAPKLVQSMYIFKQPYIGGEVTCHQDATFLYTKPLSVVGLWLAVEDATEENGCLWALAGGHRSNLKARFARAATGGTKFEVLDATPWPTTGLTPLPVRAGTVIALHGLLPHLSYANRTPHSRHAYTLHFIDVNAQYPADNWLQIK